MAAVRTVCRKLLISCLQVFHILTSGVFEPSQSLPEETQRIYIQLLATAAAAIDDRCDCAAHLPVHELLRCQMCLVIIAAFDDWSDFAMHVFSKIF